MKKLLSTAMALVLIIGLLTGCSVESQGEKTESVSNQYYLYYLNKYETKVTKTRYYPEQESAEFMLQDLMGILNGQESSGENLPLLPAGVQLVTYRLNESLLELEFNADYSNISRTREILVRAGGKNFSSDSRNHRHKDFYRKSGAYRFQGTGCRLA